ncbi:TBC1 domain family member 30-like [Oncorhynchus kisutch]|uniref:TBC1 domain family member 30-like n=1 Tax=Oncorhynchus kisutch TaxID=8019 RepID=UPI0012DD21B9|nr:TBC1 domain family member 30-like [Oncorhynchus kisutch]
MSSQAENVAELLEIDICDGDICSEGESGVFINSGTGASFLDGFSAFQQWTGPRSRSSSGHNNTDFVSKRPRETSSPSLYPQNGLGSGAGDRVTLGDLQGQDLRAPRSSIVDCLLVELYDTYSSARLSVDSPDSSTEASSSELFCRSNTGSSFLQELQEKHTRRHQIIYLSQKAPEELSCIIGEVRYRTGLQSAKLIYISILCFSTRRVELYHRRGTLQDSVVLSIPCIALTTPSRRCAQGLQTVCPGPPDGVPRASRRCAQGLQTVCPGPPDGVPRASRRCAQGLQTVCPGPPDGVPRASRRHGAVVEQLGDGIRVGRRE